MNQRESESQACITEPNRTWRTKLNIDNTTEPNWTRRSKKKFRKKKKELNNVVCQCLSYLFVTIFFQLSRIIVGAKILVLFFPFTIMTRQCWLLTVAFLVCIGITLSAAKPRLLIVSLDGMEENHIYFLWFYWLPRSAPFIFQVFDMSI